LLRDARQAQRGNIRVFGEYSSRLPTFDAEFSAREQVIPFFVAKR